MLHNTSFRITIDCYILDTHKNASPEKLLLRLFSTQKLYDYSSQVTKCTLYEKQYCTYAVSDLHVVF